MLPLQQYSNRLMQDSRLSFSESICAYHTKRWKHIRKLIGHVRKNMEEDDIHMVRVEVKKLMSLYELAEFSDEKFKHKKTLKPLVKVYKLLGKLRDHTNALSLCLEFRIDQEILDRDRNKVKRAKKDIKTLLQRHKDDFLIMNKAADKFLTGVKSKTLDKYLKSKMKAVVKVLASSPSAEELHDTRKCIKSILYNQEISDRYHNESSETKHLRIMEKQISRWHDLFMFKHKLLRIEYDLADPQAYDQVKSAELKSSMDIIKKKQPPRYT